MVKANLGRRKNGKPKKVDLGHGGNVKSARKFIKKGGLEKQKLKRKIAKSKRTREQYKKDRNDARNAKSKLRSAEVSAEEEQALVADADPKAPGFEALSGMAVDDFLSGSFLDGVDGDDDDDDDGNDDGADQEDQDEDEDSGGDGADEGDDDDFSLKTHKKELLDLQKKDPEFFEFLKREQPGLLSFGEGEEDEDEGEGDDDEDREGEGGGKMEQDGDDDDDDEEEEDEEEDHDDLGSSTLLTTALLRQLEESVTKKKSLKGLIKLVQAFSAGINMEEERKRGGGSERAFAIRSTAVLEDLMLTCATKVWIGLEHHLGKTKLAKANVGEDMQGSNYLPSQSPKWERLRPMVKSFLGNLLTFLSQLSDREENTARLVLGECKHYAPYFASIPRLLRKYNAALLTLWTKTPHEDVRIASYVRVRQLAIIAPFPFIESSLKSTYLAFVRNAKYMNEISRPAISMMMRCVVEHYGLEMRSSYQFAFVYIRQLAVHLRNAMTDGGKDAVKSCCNWQFLNCLRLWVAVLAAYPGENELGALVYPMVQILLGTLTVLRTARFRFLPMRFHVAELIVHLSVATDTYIPLAPPLLRCLSAFAGGSGAYASVSGGGAAAGRSARGRRGRPKMDEFTGKVPQLELSVRISKQHAQSRAFQDSAIERALNLLEEFMEAQKFTAAFPELSFPVEEALRSFEKACGVARWRQQAKALRARLAKHSKLVVRKRSDVGISPHNEAAVAAFLAPERRDNLKAQRKRFAEALRQRSLVTEEQKRMLESAAAAAAKSAKAKEKRERREKRRKAGVGDDDEDDDEEEEEEEEEGQEEREAREERQRKKREQKKKKTKKVSDEARKMWTQLTSQQEDEVGALEFSDED